MVALPKEGGTASSDAVGSFGIVVVCKDAVFLGTGETAQKGSVSQRHPRVAGLQRGTRNLQPERVLLTKIANWYSPQRCLRCFQIEQLPFTRD